MKTPGGADGHPGEVDIADGVVPGLQAGAGRRVHVLLYTWQWPYKKYLDIYKFYLTFSSACPSSQNVYLTFIFYLSTFSYVRNTVG